MLTTMAFALTMQLTGAARPGDFSWATSRQRLGSELRLVEQRLGRPLTLTESGAVFVVSGCRVEYWLGAHDGITRITAPVTPNCHPSPEGIPITPAMTLGTVFRPGSHYGAECLGSCGDPGTPTLVLTRVGRIDAANSWSLFFHASDERASQAWLRALPPAAAARVAAEGRIIDVGAPPAGAIPLLRQARIVRVELNLFRPSAPAVAPLP